MPYISKPFFDSEEEKKKQQNNNSFNISNNSSSTFNQNTNLQSNNQPKAATRSGSWVNLQSYLDANKDNASKMSDDLTQKVDSEAQSSQDKLSSIKSPELVTNKSFDDLDKTYYSNNNANKDDYANFKSNGGYSGPQQIDDVEGWSDAYTSASQASNKLDQSKTEEGRKSLLQDVYARPNYSQGMKNLDNLLLQNDTSSKSKFENLQNKWSGITSLLDSKQKELNDSIQSNVTTALNNKNYIPQAESLAKNNILNPIQNRVNDYNASRSQKQKDVSNDLSDSVLNDNTLNLLGLNDGQKLYDLNLNNYVTYDQTQAGLDNMASSDERAKWQALMNLINDPVMGQQISAANQSQALNPISFNKDQFLKDYAGKEAEYNSKANVLNSEKSSLENEFNQLNQEWQKNNIFGESLEDMYRQLDQGMRSPLIQRMRDIQTRLSQIPNEQNNLNNMYQSSRRIQRG